MTNNWHAEALCTQVDPELFFAEYVGQALHAGKRICRVCPVRAECLEEALSVGVAIDGVWGGLTEFERRPLLRARRVA